MLRGFGALSGQLRMRYVIVAVSIAFFLIWDGWKNDGEYLAMAVRFLKNVFSVIGLG